MAIVWYPKLHRSGSKGQEIELADSMSLQEIQLGNLFSILPRSGSVDPQVLLLQVVGGGGNESPQKPKTTPPSYLELLRLGDQQALKVSTILAGIIDYDNHKEIRLWVHSGRGKNTFGTQTIHRDISWSSMAGYNLPNERARAVTCLRSVWWPGTQSIRNPMCKEMAPRMCAGGGR